MSKVAEFKKDYTDQIMEELRGKRFVAVSYDKSDGTLKYYHNGLNPQEVVFICQHMIQREIELTRVDEDE